MLCCEIMKRHVYTATENTNVATAARSMLENRVGFLPIVDEAGRPIGVVTDRDLALRVCAENLLPSETYLGEVMTKDPVWCSDQADVEHAQSLIVERQVRRILVVDENDRLVGLVTLADLLHLLPPISAADSSWANQTSAMRFRQER